MKTCLKCNSLLPVTGFYKTPNTRDGYFNECKECTKIRTRKNRANNIEHYRLYDATPERLQRKRDYHKSERGRMAQRRCEEKYPIKEKARTALTNAIRDGRLIRQPCEVCGATKVEGHHDDYGKPLDVRWLCKKHHMELHRSIAA